MVAFPEKHPTINTPRLVLQNLRTADLQRFLEISRVLKPELTLTLIQEKLIEIDQIFDTQQGITWGIWYSNNLVGTVGYYRGFEADIGEIGYVLLPSYYRLGIMSEACERVIDYGFKKMGLVAVDAWTKQDNVPSIGLLHKLGFENMHHLDGDHERFLLKKSGANPQFSL